MPQNSFSVFDLLDLAPLERDIVLSISRGGPADLARLSLALDVSPADVQSALAALEQKQRIIRLSGGQVDVNLGYVRRPTNLPENFWPALLAAERVYSRKDIAVLQTAFPMLQFARMRLTQYSDHGPSHALRVKSFAAQLGYLLDLNKIEHSILRSAALFHDIGNIVERERHHEISQETVIRLAALGRLPFSRQEADLVGLVCRWHRREYDPGQVDYLDGSQVRTGLLACILRVADAMDIDNRRSDYDQRLRGALEFFFPTQLPYFTSLEEIAGVRVRAESSGIKGSAPPRVHLEVFTHTPVSGNMQIAGLEKDIASTPLYWKVHVRALSQPEDQARKHDDQNAALPGSCAVVAFPLEPHSLIMAAISRRHLEEAGCQVEMLCYPDAAAGPAWLWGSVLTEFASRTTGGEIRRLVVIGDRPDSSLLPTIIKTVQKWQEKGAQISVINRHEANWSRIPRLLEAGVDIILGGDWAYYWGDSTSAVDFTWSQIAALCNHDPTLSTIGVTGQETAVMRGVLNAVYNAALQLTQSGEDPAAAQREAAALAGPILDRIAANDRDYFASQADDFITRYATPNRTGQVNGRLLIFDGPPGTTPYKCQWALEAAIERLGRGMTRGVHFNTPYAVATWPDGDAVELVAINHWREEDAIPIRLLYPRDIGPEPRGLESIVQARLTPEEAREILIKLGEVCNREA